MLYELKIGLRYTFSQKENKNLFISFISLISILGTALGVAVLIIVLSVMNGFQKELRTRILGAASHIEIQGFNNHTLDNWKELSQEVVQNPDIVSAAPYVLKQGMLVSGRTVRGVLIRGINPNQETSVTDFSKNMVSGEYASLEEEKYNILIGSTLASYLGTSVGEKITLMTPDSINTPASILPRMKQLTVSGIFDMGMHDQDAGLVLINLKDAQKIYRLNESVSGLRLLTNDFFKAPLISQKLNQKLATKKENIISIDWTQQYANFFRAVSIEKKMMFLILLLIVAVATFNIVSTLVMAVHEKQSEIAILRTIGSTPYSVMLIFIVQGFLIGLIGVSSGVIVGILVAHNIDIIIPFIERIIGTQFLNREIYLISDLPSDLQLLDVITITCISLILTFLSAIYPAYRASKTSPVTSLKYE